MRDAAIGACSFGSARNVRGGRIGIPLPSMIPGTIRKPPPIPKNPEIAPVTNPTAIKRPAMTGLSRTVGSQPLARGRSIAIPTATITRANRIRSFLPSTSLPTVDPAVAPSTPAAAKAAAHGQLTLPRRQCPTRLPSALTPTAKALVPIATCGLRTPTTYSSSGTARIDPPPPIRPSENPTRLTFRRCREAFPGNFRRGRGGSLGSLRRFEFDQVQGLSLPSPQ